VVVHAGRNVSWLMQLDMQAVLPWSLALARRLLVWSVLLVSVLYGSKVWAVASKLLVQSCWLGDLFCLLELQLQMVGIMYDCGQIVSVVLRHSSWVQGYCVPFVCGIRTQ
jgi:hypothetical protein